MSQKDATPQLLHLQMKPLITSFKIKALTCMSLSLASVRSLQMTCNNIQEVRLILILILFSNHHSNNKLTIKVIAIHLRTVGSLPQAILSALKWERLSLRYLKIASAAPIKCLCQIMNPQMLLLAQLVTGSVDAATIGFLGSLTIRVNSSKRNS